MAVIPIHELLKLRGSSASIVLIKPPYSSASTTKRCMIFVYTGTCALAPTKTSFKKPRRASTSSSIRRQLPEFSHEFPWWLSDFRRCHATTFG